MILRRLVLLAAIAVLAAAGVALAAKGGSGNVTLCAKGEAGELSLAKGGKCADGARKLSLAKQGPRGEGGAPGLAGAAGPAGPDASAAALAPEPVRFVQGRAPRESCAAAPAAFCSYYHQEQGYDNAGSGFSRVGYFRDGSGIVHLQGTTRFACPNGQCEGYYPAYVTVFYLPPGYRPSANLRFPLGPCSSEQRYVSVDTSGAVTLSSPSCGYDALDGVSFLP